MISTLRNPLVADLDLARLVHRERAQLRLGGRSAAVGARRGHHPTGVGGLLRPAHQGRGHPSGAGRYDAFLAFTFRLTEITGVTAGDGVRDAGQRAVFVERHRERVRRAVGQTTDRARRVSRRARRTTRARRHEVAPRSGTPPVMRGSASRRPSPARCPGPRSTAVAFARRDRRCR